MRLRFGIDWVQGLLQFAILGIMGAGIAYGAPLTVARDGRSDYVISVAADAIAPEKKAAEELHAYLRKVTGTELPIRPEGEVGAEARQIVIGPSARFRQLAPDVDVSALGEEGIVLRTVGDTLLLAGGRPPGTIYAVYTFLEDVVGCRWWTSKESTIPKRPTLSVPALNKVYVPQFQYREVFYVDVEEPMFAVKLKCNGAFEAIPPEYGGHHYIWGWCHTFYYLLPPERYFAKHPEWYSLLNGKRTAEGSQLCLTNPEMKAELVRQALGWLSNEPSPFMVSISQNDCGGPCECANCRALEKKEGSQSGPILHFVNSVAEEIEKQYPNVLVETIAYGYSRKPPRHVRPRRNVVICISPIDCSFAHPMARNRWNASFCRDLEAWQKIAPRLYVWNYVANLSNYYLPNPNLRQLAPQVRFFAKHNASGLFEQGNGNARYGDFAELRIWLLAHLLWDPSLDERKLVPEFLTGYYGPAAPAIQKVIDVIYEAWKRSGARIGCYWPDTYTSAFLNLRDLRKATALFDQAQKAVEGDEVLSKRVRRARLSLDLVWLTRYEWLRRTAKASGQPFGGPEDPIAACHDFMRVVKENDETYYGDGIKFADYEKSLLESFRPPAPEPEICRNLPEEDWVDIQDSKMFLVNPGIWAKYVDDPAASDGKAAWMPGDHSQWGVQYGIPLELAEMSPVHCYAFIRCEVKAAKGLAYSLGLYDPDRRKVTAPKEVKIEEAGGGGYHWCDLGVQRLRRGMLFWVAPPGAKDAVASVYVDRLLFVREKSKRG